MTEHRFHGVRFTVQRVGLEQLIQFAGGSTYQHRWTREEAIAFACGWIVGVHGPEPEPESESRGIVLQFPAAQIVLPLD